MPIKRLEALYTAETWTAGGTWKDKLPATGNLAGLLVVAEGTSVSGATAATEAWKLADLLDKVEVLGNGSTVIHSIDWKHFQFMNYLDTGKLGPTWWRNYAAGVQREACFIPFGRFPWDTEYGLILNRWNRVELSLKNNTSGTYHTGNLSVSVSALFLEDFANPFPRGYLRKEEFREWLTVASAREPVELPTTNPLRGVHLQIIPDLDANFISETSMSNLAYDLDFTIEHPNMKMNEQSVWHKQLLNEWEHSGIGLTAGFAAKTADYGFDVGLGYVTGMAGISGSKDGAVSSVVPTINGDNNNNTQSFESAEADSPVQFMALGMSPNNCMSLHYVRDCDPSWLLDPARLGVLKLNVETRNAASAADGTIRVLLDSVYQHPLQRV